MEIKYRIGVMPGPWPTGADGNADFFWRFVETCEKSAIDSVWFSERLSSPIPIPEPITAMAAIAARTTRLKFGPSVLVTPFRSPVMVARELAMIDYLSHGRMLPAFGIGAEQEREFLAAGVPFKERGRRTDEAIAMLKSLCGADGGGFLPKPVQRPHPPLWIGGRSEAALRRAARAGDAWHPSHLTVDELRRQIPALHAECERAGRPADEVAVTTRRKLVRGPTDDARVLQGDAGAIAATVAELEQVGVSHLVVEIPGSSEGELLENLDWFGREVLLEVSA